MPSYIDFVFKMTSSPLALIPTFKLISNHEYGLTNKTLLPFLKGYINYWLANPPMLWIKSKHNPLLYLMLCMSYLSTVFHNKNIYEISWVCGNAR